MLSPERGMSAGLGIEVASSSRFSSRLWKKNISSPHLLPLFFRLQSLSHLFSIYFLLLPSFLLPYLYGSPKLVRASVSRKRRKMVCLLTPGDIFGKGGGGCFEFSNLIIAPATLVRDIFCGNQEVGRFRRSKSLVSWRRDSIPSADPISIFFVSCLVR